MEANQQQKLTHWKEYFKYDYLGSYSFEDGEKEKVLTIKKAELRKVIGVGGKKDDLLVCDFVEKEKPMILNRTNCKAITKAYNNQYPEQWAGFRIAIYVEHNVKFGSETTDGLRVRDQRPGNEITVESLRELVAAKWDLLTETEAKNVKKVIDGNESNRFQGVQDFLNSKQ